jgi:hypothetical protein
MSGISRDQGLKRISVVTRWVGVAGIAGAGVFAAIVGKAHPGRTTVTTPAVSGSAPSAVTGSAASAASSAGDQPTVDPATGSQVDNGLQAPADVPQATGRHSAVVSGGS